MKRGSGQPCKS